MSTVQWYLKTMYSWYRHIPVWIRGLSHLFFLAQAHPFFDVLPKRLKNFCLYQYNLSELLKMKKSIKERIRTSKTINKIYTQYEDFNHGRSFFGKFTSLTNEFNFAMLAATFLFGINLKDHVPEAVKFTLLVLFGVYIFGKLYNKSNVLEAEQRACANRNPLAKINLRAAEIIIARFGGDKDFEKQIREEFNNEGKEKV